MALLVLSIPRGSLLLLATCLALSSCSPIREDRSATKTFDQRQQGTTNIQAHLDNIVVILVPSNRISITDFAAKSEPPSKFLETLSELKSHASPVDDEPGHPQFYNSIPESKSKSEEEGEKVEEKIPPSVHVTKIGSIPILPASIQINSDQERSEAFTSKHEEKNAETKEASDDKMKPSQTDGSAKKFPFQIDTHPLEIPVLIIQDP